MKFPYRENYESGAAHLAALDKYMKQSELLQAELTGMFRKTVKQDTLPEWSDSFMVAGLLPVPEDLKSIVGNLVGVTLENEKRIVDTAKGICKGEWFFAVRVE